MMMRELMVERCSSVTLLLTRLTISWSCTPWVSWKAFKAFVLGRYCSVLYTHRRDDMQSTAYWECLVIHSALSTVTFMRSSRHVSKSLASVFLIDSSTFINHFSMFERKSFVFTFSRKMISSFPIERTPMISVYLAPKTKECTPTKHFLRFYCTCYGSLASASVDISSSLERKKKRGNSILLISRWCSREC